MEQNLRDLLPPKTIKNRIKKKGKIKQNSLSREFFFKEPPPPLHSSRRGVKNLHNFASAWTQPTIIIPPPAARVSSPTVNSNVLKNFSNVHKFGGMKVDLVFAVRHRVPNRSARRQNTKGVGGARERERKRDEGARKRKTETSRLFITFTGSTGRMAEGALCITPAATRQMAIVWTRNVGSNGCPSGPLFQLFQASIIATRVPLFRRPPPSRFPKYETYTRAHTRVRVDEYAWRPPSTKTGPAAKQTICYL